MEQSGKTRVLIAFNRVARLVWRILVDAGVLCTNFFDDYPILNFGFSCRDSACGQIGYVNAWIWMFGGQGGRVLREDGNVGRCFDTSEAEKVNVLVSKPSRVECLSKNIDEVLKVGSIKSYDVARCSDVCSLQNTSYLEGLANWRWQSSGSLKTRGVLSDY